jgi:hypothetical protein
MLRLLPQRPLLFPALRAGPCASIVRAAAAPAPGPVRLPVHVCGRLLSTTASPSSAAPPLAVVTLFTHSDCSLCIPVKFIINKLLAQAQAQAQAPAAAAVPVSVRVPPFRFEEVDIRAPANKQWHEQYQYDIPVVHVNGREAARHRLSERTLIDALRAAASAAGGEAAANKS